MITVILSCILALFGHVIFGWLTSNAEIIKMGVTILVIDIVLEIGRPVNIFATNALRAAGDVNYPFYVGLVVMWSVAVGLGYPQALMANEVQVQLNGTKKRCDTVLYRRDLTARMIVEYKAPEVEITQKVFDQITRYNMVLKVDYLIVSNGIRHYCCRMDYEQNSYTFLQDIPDYASL